jgi:hypothetical protein
LEKRLSLLWKVGFVLWNANVSDAITYEALVASKTKHTFPVQRFALQRAATEKLKRGNLCLRYDEIEVSQGLILLHREPRCGCSEMQHLLRLVT